MRDHPDAPPSLPLPTTVPTVPSVQQPALFAMDLSADAERLLEQIDGMRDLRALAKEIDFELDRCRRAAAELFRTGRAREATPRQMRESAAKLLGAGRIDDALALYRRILALDPRDLTARKDLAEALILANCPDEAAGILRRLVEMLLRENRPTEAVQITRQVLALRLPDISLLAASAQILRRCGEIDEAAALWLDAVERHLAAGQRSLALETLAAGLQSLPDHDGLHSIHDRLQQEREAAGEMRSSSFPERRVSRLHILGILAVVLLLLLAGYEYLVQQRIDRALTATRPYRRSTANESPPQRAARLQKAMALLAQARPRFSLLRHPRWDRGHAEVQEAYERTATELSRFRDWQRSVIERWKSAAPETRRNDEALLMSLREAATTPGDNGTPALEARTLLAVYEETMARRKQERAGLLARLRDRRLAAAERHHAYSRLLRAYPGVFKEKNLTVPVRIEARSNTGMPLPARVLLGETAWPRPTPCVAELPCANEKPVRLRLEGYAPRQLEAPGRVLQASYVLDLERAARWRTTVQRPPLLRALLSIDGRYAVVLDREVRCFDCESGRLLWRHAPEIPPEARHAVIGRSMLVCPDSTGHIIAYELATGRERWRRKLPPAAKVAGVLLSPLGLNAARPDGLDCIVSGREIPVMALDGGTGETLWPESPSARQLLRESIPAPVTKPYHDGWNLVLPCTDGSMQLLFVNGALSARIRLPGVESLPPEAVVLPDRRDGVVVAWFAPGKGLCLYGVSWQDRPEAKKLRQLSEFADDTLGAPLLVDGRTLFAGFRSGRIVRVRLEEKEDIRQNMRAPGPVSGPLARNRGLLLVPHEAGGETTAGVIAFDLAHAGPPAARWRFPTGERAPRELGVSGGAERHPVLIAAPERIWLLEEECSPSP